MDRSLPYDLGIGTVTGVISAVVLGIVAIVWKRIKNMRNISMGQPENPFAGEQFVIDMTSSGPLTSSPFSSPPTSPTPSRICGQEPPTEISDDAKRISMSGQEYAMKVFDKAVKNNMEKIQEIIKKKRD